MNEREHPDMLCPVVGYIKGWLVTVTTCPEGFSTTNWTCTSVTPGGFGFGNVKFQMSNASVPAVYPDW